MQPIEFSVIYMPDNKVLIKCNKQVHIGEMQPNGSVRYIYITYDHNEVEIFLSMTGVVVVADSEVYNKRWSCMVEDKTGFLAKLDDPSNEIAWLL